MEPGGDEGYDGGIFSSDAPRLTAKGRMLFRRHCGASVTQWRLGYPAVHQPDDCAEM